MNEIRLALGDAFIGLAVFAAIVVALASIGDRSSRIWDWLAVLAHAAVCTMPVALALAAAALAYSDVPGRAALAIAAGGATSAVCFRITWTELVAAIGRARGTSLTARPPRS